MNIQNLRFNYPPDLIATASKKNFRILFSANNESEDFKEISKLQLLNKFSKGDVLVINNTKVEKRRLFSEEPLVLEVLFVKKITGPKLINETWEVLFPSKKMQIGDILNLPLGVKLKLVKKSMPQVVELSQTLTVEYFQKYGQMPLPPYIQKARDNRNNTKSDEVDYQTAWAKHWGSCAAPTASLHFTQEDLEYLKTQRKVKVVELTLHVGLGTFLPIKVDDLSRHKMHKEWLQIPSKSLKTILDAKSKNLKIWALGTTVTRAIETWALSVKNQKKDLLKLKITEDFITESQLFIVPGFNFSIVDRLMTNFHQPESTLLAMLMAFVGREKTIRAYRWAIEKKFRLFSYGDLSVWEKESDDR